MTPIADTNGGTPLGSSAKFTPGTYDFVVQAPGYGLTALHEDVHRGPDGDGDVPAADELGVCRERRVRLGRRHSDSAA